MATTSELEKVAEAMTAELATAALSQEIAPVRSYDASAELKDTDALHVDVVPVVSAVEVESRNSLSYDNAVDIGIRKRFGIDDQDPVTGKILTAKIDLLLLLEQEIVQFFSLRRLTEYPEAVFVDVEVRVGWVPDHMRQWRQFTGIVRVIYRTSMDL